MTQYQNSFEYRPAEFLLYGRKKFSREYNLADRITNKFWRELNLADFDQIRQIRQIFFPAKFLSLMYSVSNQIVYRLTFSLYCFVCQEYHKELSTAIKDVDAEYIYNYDETILQDSPGKEKILVQKGAMRRVEKWVEQAYR